MRVNRNPVWWPAVALVLGVAACGGTGTTGLQARTADAARTPPPSTGCAEQTASDMSLHLEELEWLVDQASAQGRVVGGESPEAAMASLAGDDDSALPAATARDRATYMAFSGMLDAYTEGHVVAAPVADWSHVHEYLWGDTRLVLAEARGRWIVAGHTIPLPAELC